MRTIFTSLILTFCILFSNPIHAQNALHFDGTNDQVNCGTDSAFDIGAKSITVEAWVYATAWKSNIYDGSIVIKEDNSSNTGWMLRAGSSGRLGFGMGEGSKSWTEINTSSAVLSLYTWHHVAATYDGSKIRLYVDGAVVDSLTTNIHVAVDHNTPLTIGYHPTYGRHWQGSIDEVRVWNTVRSAEEIEDNMNDEFCEHQTGLKAYYKFDHGEIHGNNSGINSVADYSGNGNDGTLSNFALTGSSSNWVGGAGLSQEATYAFDTINSCGNYYDAVNNIYYTTSGTYYDTINTYVGCDSVTVREVAINHNSNTTLNVSVCETYLSPAGNTYIKTGTYYDFLDNAAGCDSIITIKLKVGADSGRVDTSVCSVYTSPSGDLTVNQSGIYFDLIPSNLGCDSVITIFLTVLGETSSQVDLNMCDSVESPSGKFWYFVEGIYSDTLMNANLCDSVVEVTVIDKKIFETIEDQACYTYQSVTGKTYSESGTYLDTIKTAECYKVYTTELQILESTESSMEMEGCFKVESATDSRIFTNSGVYYDTLVNHMGCDSFVTMNVSVNTVNTNVSFTDRELTAESDGELQWLNCGDSYSQVEGATSQVFTAEHSGSYSVEVTENECLDTSVCYSIIGAGLDPDFTASIRVYPNPTNGLIVLEGPGLANFKYVEIRSAHGTLVYQSNLDALNRTELNPELAAGNYMIRLVSETELITLHLVVIN